MKRHENLIKKSNKDMEFHAFQQFMTNQIIKVFGISKKDLDKPIKQLKKERNITNEI